MRFCAVMMTSFDFILGVYPPVVAYSLDGACTDRRSLRRSMLHPPHVLIHMLGVIGLSGAKHAQSIRTGANPQLQTRTCWII
jgi:hypothetical protein